MLPIPDMCVAALKERSEQQVVDKAAAGVAWVDNGSVITTRHGTPYEPRNVSPLVVRARRSSSR
ncbi:hypothetical protein [Nonomuraea monospora]|uniref:hypothetical protein n=1 Tax=Nonomuraea monospora TaxID=568818 RepID=UPI00165255E6